MIRFASPHTVSSLFPYENETTCVFLGVTTRFTRFLQSMAFPTPFPFLFLLFFASHEKPCAL